MGCDKEMEGPGARTGYVGLMKESRDEELMVTVGFWLEQLRGMAAVG